MELTEAQKEAVRLAEEEREAVYRNAYLEMFGELPRRFPLDVSFHFLIRFLNDFMRILINKILSNFLGL